RDELQQTRQARGLEFLIAAHQDEALGYQRGIVEVEGAQIVEQLAVRFGDERHVKRLALSVCMMKTDLCRKNRLAAAGWPLEQIHAVLHQAVTQDAIQAGNAGGDALRKRVAV